MSALEKGTVRVKCLDQEHYQTASTTGPGYWPWSNVLVHVHVKKQKATERVATV